MNQHTLALRLTPSTSPFLKSSTPRSPTKVSRTEEPGLKLHKIIGTTTDAANGFDYLPSQRKFAYTAGAAAVVATVGEDLKVTQRFFKARPTLSGSSRDAAGQLPVSPTPHESRNRVLGHAKESSLGGSPLGASGREWSDSGVGRSTTAKDRVKAATSVALSPNGKWLAVGETGYKPRVLIFSLSEGSSDAPVAVIAEHTFGVHALSFSPDSRFLASLGVVNDGFLYVWAIEDRTGSASLHASNKCTVLVNDMIWMGGSIVTVGLRFVKVWRPDESAPSEARRVENTLSPPAPRHRADNRSSDYGNSVLSPRHKVLAGKNSLLGELLDANFIRVLLLSDTEALLCAETGEICLLDDSDKAQVLTPLAIADLHVSAARLDGRGSLHMAGKDGQMKSFNVETLRDCASDFNQQTRRQTVVRSKPSSVNCSAVVAMCTFDDIILEIDSKGSMHLTNNAANGVDVNGAIANQLPGHDGPIAGVQAYSYDTIPDAAFFSYSTNGVVQFWNDSGEPVMRICVPVETSPMMYDLTNELKAAVPLANGTLLVAGDKYGTLTILELKTGDVLAQVRAHSAEIGDLCRVNRPGIELVATAGRDRMIQLLTWNESQVDLLQTMDEHAGAVTKLSATAKGDALLSCSADRTVVIRDAVLRDEGNPASLAYVIRRTITLKSSPTSICFTNEPDVMLLAATDRSISQFSIRTGQAGFSFKCSDGDGGEAAVMSSIVHVPSLNGTPTIVGVSSSDKSVRLYSEYGTLVARDWGHTEGITDVTVLPSSSVDGVELYDTVRLVSVAADSTVFLWDTSLQPNGAARKTSDTNGLLEAPDKVPPIGPPLRKVLSYSELSRIRREKPADGGEPTSPTVANTPGQASSPQRLRKKTSRMSVAQAPRFEPAFRSSLASPPRRRSLIQRSPSPPSPRNTVRKDHVRRPSLAAPLRPQSSENVHTASQSTSAAPANGFGSLTSSTESVCRTLRAYRKRLTTGSSTNDIAPDALRELEKELKVTLRVLTERSQGNNVDEAVMARLLDQASEKIVGMLDERIKERVESEVRKSGGGSPASTHNWGVSEEVREQDEASDALAGALEKVALEG